MIGAVALIRLCAEAATEISGTSSRYIFSHSQEGGFGLSYPFIVYEIHLVEQYSVCTSYLSAHTAEALTRRQRFGLAYVT
jgi:hypothetical protein